MFGNDADALSDAPHVGIATAATADRAVRVGGRLLALDHNGELPVALLQDGSGPEATGRSRVEVATEPRLWRVSVRPGDHVEFVVDTVRHAPAGPTLVASGWRVLSTARRELPPADSLDDPAFRRRNRHLELLWEERPRRFVVQRSRIVQALRQELWQQGYLEIDTPLLQFADEEFADRSFAVQVSTVDAPAYLRASPLYVKRLLAAGFDRFFEIARTFRDETADATHVIEYSLLELCLAYADYEDAREVVRRLVRAAAAAVGADLPAHWRVASVHDAVAEAVGEQVTPGTDGRRMAEIARTRGVAVPTGWTADQILLELYDRLVEPATTHPTFYVDFPHSLTPFARVHPRDARLAQKWDLVIQGREIASSYSELVDPEELRKALSAPVGPEATAETSAVDEDFLSIIDTGLPPCAGLAIGLERLVMTLTGATAIRDVIPFAGGGLE